MNMLGECCARGHYIFPSLLTFSQRCHLIPIVQLRFCSRRHRHNYILNTLMDITQCVSVLLSFLMSGEFTTTWNMLQYSDRWCNLASAVDLLHGPLATSAKGQFTFLYKPASLPSTPPWLCLPLNINFNKPGITTKHRTLPDMMTQRALGRILEIYRSHIYVYTNDSSTAKSSFGFTFLRYQWRHGLALATQVYEASHRPTTWAQSSDGVKSKTCDQLLRGPIKTRWEEGFSGGPWKNRVR